MTKYGISSLFAFAILLFIPISTYAEDFQVAPLGEIEGISDISLETRAKKGKKGPVVNAGGIYLGNFLLKSVKSHPQVNCQASTGYSAGFEIVQSGKKVTIFTPDGTTLKGKASKKGVKGKITRPLNGAIVTDSLIFKRITNTSAKITYKQTAVINGITACKFTYTGSFNRL